MKKILILFDSIGSKAHYISKFITDNYGDIDVTLATFFDLIFEVEGEKVNIWVSKSNLKDFDLVYIRRADHTVFALAGTLALCMDKLGIRYFDRSFREIGAAGDKFTSYTKLSLSGLPTIPAFFCFRENLESIKNKIISKFGFPIVAKDMTSQHSTGIYAIRSESDFDKLPKKRGERKLNYLFQKHVDIDSEYRLLVLGNKVVSGQVIKRDLSGFSAKIDMGRKEVFKALTSISSQMKKVAVDGAKALNIQIAGADIFIEKGTNKVGIFEVNRGPGFTYDPEISPELPELAKFFKESL